MITWNDIHQIGPIGTQHLPEDARITGADIDSRRIKSGMLFIARQGDQADGHQFIEQAFMNGAVAAIVESRWYDSAENSDGLPLIVVEDSDSALRGLAAQVRSNFSGPVLGITGSNGKTTTKEMTAEILGAQYTVLSTPGNFNNLWGLPLTILQAQQEHDFWVLEMGTNHPGEIEALCDIASPTAGLITTVNESHSEHFHSLEAIAKEKLMLFESIPEGGIIFQNLDNEFIAKYSSPGKTVITYSVETKAQKTAQITSIDPYSRVHCQINGIGKVRLGVPGVFQISNALAAVTIADTYGVPGEVIQDRLESFHGVPGRVKIVEKQNYTVIDDTYNANPASMREAIDILAKMPAGSRRIAILGDMLELNSTRERKHRDIGEYLGEHRIDIVIGVGELARNIIKGVQTTSTAETYHFDDYVECMNSIRGIVHTGDIILVKASHGIHLEKVVGAL
ncbi:MAG: UDP-N-acetylmuramoyl-tripeptide--D-alanyl-D-alanine ligase [Candidatus Marinimicrobia bacterium]|nr:UDP-N-acetylmuramoyl-tripeptide--D-alanyl-D-alanine ligase [Candidatus Neomarinimicrobiota bacterium]MCF7829621.1 UDP-N-acetylmuramoyl-tripeptide--D-alanyl-D-alanine ligase [Candidatus Neomarinimicrobiota bacterium]MCF7879781.1 UDP-N-acetylmuramoyl-tripeptide--D-alanyl-D-alanine ligase [Candidatus Neomarinimicrobiota bacterium]